MLGLKRNMLVFAILLTSLLLGIQAIHAAPTDCADGDIDACWARFYTADGPMGEEGRVYFRIFRACPDGIRIGIATNVQDNYTFYIKQYGGGEAPPFRLLTDETNVALNHYPAGVEIEFTNESAASYAGTTTVYYLKVFNVGWSEVFDSDYMDGIMIGSSDYGFSEDDTTGIVRAGDFEHCYTFNAPFEKFISPFVQCVKPGPHHSLTAVFGYYNRQRIDSIIPNGPYNYLKRIFGGLIQAELPTLFEPGIHYNAFSITADTHSFVWRLSGASAVASVFSPRCHKK
jgi:hypothetical protein